MTFRLSRLIVPHRLHTARRIHASAPLGRSPIGPRTMQKLIRASTTTIQARPGLCELGLCIRHRRLKMLTRVVGAASLYSRISSSTRGTGSHFTPTVPCRCGTVATAFSLCFAEALTVAAARLSNRHT